MYIISFKIDEYIPNPRGEIYKKNMIGVVRSLVKCMQHTTVSISNLKFTQYTYINDT
jgi:hypothetical protein